MSALTSEDGAFSIKAELAVELAYMLSTAESIILNDPMQGTEIGMLIVDYLSGHSSIEEVMEELRNG